MLGVIKEVVKQTVEAEKPADFTVGIVLSAEPIKIRVTDKLVLGKNQIAVCERLTDRFAPIGHSVEVCGVGEKSVDFDLRVDLEDGYIIDDVMGNIENALGDYLKELRSGWADSENIVVYKFVAGSRALSVGRVKNVADIKLSNSSGDLILGADEIPVRGYVNVTA